MSSELLLTEDRGPVRILTMNRPEKRNALNRALTQALLDGLRAADADDSIRSIVLTGAGPAFCAGADLTEFKDLTPDKAHLVAQRAELTMNLQGIFSRLTKPVVTAVNGAAMGGGAGLALAGDVALMASTAKLGYPEVRHGIVAAVVMAGSAAQCRLQGGVRAGGRRRAGGRGARPGARSRQSRERARCADDGGVRHGGAIRRRRPRGHGRDQGAVLPCARPAVRAGAGGGPRRQQAHARVPDIVRSAERIAQLKEARAT